MPSSRRIKTTIIFILFSIVIIIYVSTSASETRANKFYTSTRDALNHRIQHETPLKDLLNDDAHKQARLKDAEENVKIGADRTTISSHVEEPKEHAQKPKLDVNDEMEETGEDGVAKKIVRPGTDPLIVKTKEKVDRQREKEKETETKEEHNAEEELNFILKRGPIIIFSKTFCPYSKKAKTILLQRYKINPEPYVVELDKHRIGTDLQAQLAKITGRNTVPNVLVNGVSIGGGDDVENLHRSGDLVKKITSLAGQKVIMTPKR